MRKRAYIAIVRVCHDIGYRSLEFRQYSDKGTIIGGPLPPMEVREIKPSEVAQYLEFVGEHLSLDHVTHVAYDTDNGLRVIDLTVNGGSLRSVLEQRLEWPKAAKSPQWTRGIRPWRKPAEA